MYFDAKTSLLTSIFFLFLIARQKEKENRGKKKEKNTQPKNQPQCPNGHKTKLMLQALACTLTLTIAAKLHVRGVWFVSKWKFTPTTTLLFYYQAMPDLQSFYSVVLAKATQLDSALPNCSLQPKADVVIITITCFSLSFCLCFLSLFAS